jgi:DNA ligase-1
MKFLHVAQVFADIKKVSSRITMTQLLGDLLRQASPDEAQVLCYLSLGVVRPVYQGNQFNLAAKSITEFVAQQCNMTESQAKHELHTMGDFGAVLQAYCTMCSSQHHVSIMYVYKELVAIEALEGKGSMQSRLDMLKAVCDQLSAIEQGLVVNIITGSLRLGFSDMTVLDALSYMVTGDKSLKTSIEHAYNVCADIGYIARIIKEQQDHDEVDSTIKEKVLKRLQEIEVILGVPILPAAAERLPDAAAILEKIGPCVAQPKLDGFRLQIHVSRSRDEEKIWFFSRHLQNISQQFPELAQAFTHSSVESCILEGEAIVYNEEEHRFLPFQVTAKRKRKHDIKEAAQEFPLRLYLFDILYLNGTSCMNLSHEKRRIVLKDLFPRPLDNRVYVIEEQEITSAVQLEKLFYREIEQGLEGLVVKRPAAHYQPGKRNFNWIKLKKHESNKLLDTVDAVLVGYYYGGGRRAGFGIGALLCAVYDQEADRFVTIGKVGTGMTDEDLKMLKKQGDRYQVHQQPKQVDYPPELLPDVFVDPHLVVVIDAEEITRSPVHTAGKKDDEPGYALRFPRFMGLREDKGIYEATTIQEIKKFYGKKA